MPHPPGYRISSHTEHPTEAQKHPGATPGSSDHGKPWFQARYFGVEAAIGIVEMFASPCEAMPDQLHDSGNLRDLSLLEPYGVVAAIRPWQVF
ncbi:aldehyde dehydrogenase family protein [Streptomyces sp. NPDC020898]|uniref:aldehyde dehydrogenase family protein n=1 Tax=Streptomyces sp. NPDC020898 TaxID=3365101 RepID=UPI0037BAAB99